MKKIVLLLLPLLLIVFAAYEILTFIDNAVMSGRMRETPALRPHEEPLHIMRKGVVPFDGGEGIYRVTPGSDLKSPLQKIDTAQIKSGKILYSTYCAQCHGNYHDGNGTVGQSFHPLPTDLRSTDIQSREEGMLFKSISYGVPGGRQPPLATTVEIMDRWRIIAYLKSLGLRK